MTTNPFIDIWLNTRLTTREIIDNNYKRLMNLLFCISGIVSLFSWLTKRPDTGDRFELLPILLTLVSVGIVLGLLISRLIAISIYWTGKLVDGKSTYKEILRTTAYANVPSIGLLVMIIFKLSLFGKEPIASSRPEMMDNLLIVSFIAIVEGIIGIWTIVIYVKVISETQKLSTGMTIINLLLAFTIVGLFNYFFVLKFLES
jgi:hypothetical protein